MPKTDTAERILQTALQLMQEKGFKAVSIKEIAQLAEVSEMTIFRHFATKKKLLETAIEHHSIIASFQAIFAHQIEWKLEKDLYLIAITYLELMEANRPIFLIAIQERSIMPELMDTVSKNPIQLKQQLALYFQTMQQKQKINIANPEQQAASFLTFLFGYFVSLTFLENKFIKEPKEQFVLHCVQTYCHGIGE